METDNKVELTKVFQLSHLSAVQNLGGRKVFQIFVVRKAYRAGIQGTLTIYSHFIYITNTLLSSP